MEDCKIIRLWRREWQSERDPEINSG